MNPFKHINQRFLFILLFLVTWASKTHAQSSGLSEISTSDLTLLFMCIILFVVVLVLIAAIFLLQLLRGLLNDQLETDSTEQKETWWSRMNQTLTDAVPLENEQSVALDHDYDGIKELDNHLPPWWKWLFYATVVFAVVYMINYHVIGYGSLQGEEYQIEVALAEKAKANLAATSESTIDESTIQFDDDPVLLAKGQTIYKRNCVACHKAEGEGGIGPNLVDEYWLHGGSIQDTYNTIANGVVEKGMIAWKEVLSPSNIHAVNSYIYTLRGNEVENAKAAQGEKYVETDTLTVQ